MSEPGWAVVLFEEVIKTLEDGTGQGIGPAGLDGRSSGNVTPVATISCACLT